MIRTSSKLIFTIGTVFFACHVANAVVLEELIVTAQKREQNTQDLSVSVTAFSGEQLNALGMTNTTDIIQQVPGLQINAWSPNVTIFNLRGISQNNFQDNLEAPVAVYVDDAYVGSLNGISGQLFDLKRVEVLRGPQGTLFGRNATGGLIHYLSEGADTDELNGYIQLGAGSFERRSVELAVGGGLTDTIRGRFAGRWEETNGYIEALIPGSEDIGGADGYAMRANIQIDFSEQLLGDFWLKYSDDNDVPTGGYIFENCPVIDRNGSCDTDIFGRALVLNDPNGFGDGAGGPFAPGTAGGDVHKHLSDTRTSLNRDTTTVQAKLTYDMDNGNQLVSITNYMALNKSYIEDGDGLPAPVVILQTDADYSQSSQEFRLSGDADTMRWQVGAYYLDIDIDEFSPISGAPALFNILPPGAPLSRLPAANPQGLTDGFPGNGFSNARTIHNWQLDSTNWSVFGQTEFDLSERLVLTAGLRWSQDNKDIDFTLEYEDDFNPRVIVDTDEEFDMQVGDATTVDYGDWAGRLALDFQVSEDLLLFTSINRGIKGGNFTASIGSNITASNFQHDEEVLLSYDVGFKKDIPDAGMRINGTVFYYDYEDYQAFSLAGGAPLVENTDATLFGGELEVVWQPAVHWDFNFGLAYLETKVDEVTGPGDFRRPPPPKILDAELPNAPQWSFNYLARYSWDLSVGSIAIQFDGVWNDDQFLELTNGQGTIQEAYNVSNLRLSFVDSEDRYSITLFSNNVFDEEYKAYTLDLGNLGVTSYYAPPVTYGISAKVNL